jgi:uncharacterized protein
MRVIIDTNIWISYFLFDSFSEFEKILSNETIIIIASEKLIDEINLVFSYPKFKKVINKKNISAIINFITDRCYFITPKESKIRSRDQKDNYLIDLAISSKSIFLVTGDKDLLSLKKVSKTQIITMKELFNFLDEKSKKN